MTSSTKKWPKQVYGLATVSLSSDTPDPERQAQAVAEIKADQAAKKAAAAAKKGKEGEENEAAEA